MLRVMARSLPWFVLHLSQYLLLHTLNGVDLVSSLNTIIAFLCVTSSFCVQCSDPNPTLCTFCMFSLILSPFPSQPDLLLFVQHCFALLSMVLFLLLDRPFFAVSSCWFMNPTFQPDAHDRHKQLFPLWELLCLVISGILIGPFMLMVSALFGFHTRLIASNLTTIEYYDRFFYPTGRRGSQGVSE